MNIKKHGFRLKKTSDACPEQYDVFDKEDNQVGYIRLRHGYLTVESPVCGGDLIMDAHISGPGGGFVSEQQAEYFLDKALQRIHEWTIWRSGGIVGGKVPVSTDANKIINNAASRAYESVNEFLEYLMSEGNLVKIYSHGYKAKPLSEQAEGWGLEFVDKRSKTQINKADKALQALIEMNLITDAESDRVFGRIIKQIGECTEGKRKTQNEYDNGNKVRK